MRDFCGLSSRKKGCRQVPEGPKRPLAANLGGLDRIRVLLERQELRARACDHERTTMPGEAAARN